MQFTRSFIAIAAIVSASFNVASAQVASADTVNEAIAEVLLQMQGARIIPNLLDESRLNLHGALIQTFGGSNNISTGQLVDGTSTVATVPKWTLEYTQGAADSNQFSNATFTVMTLDPGAASDQPRNVVRHYLANNLTLSQAGQLVNTSKPVAGWFSPAPPAGDGVHRYTTLVFRQPEGTFPPEGLGHRDNEIDLNFNLSDYIEQTKLGQVIAANFFLLQNDDANAQVTATGVVSTSSVPSPSLSAAVESVSSSLSSVYAASATGKKDNGSSGAVSVSMGVSHAAVAWAATACFVALGAFAL